MKIGIDARFLGQGGGGIGRYLKNLLNAIAELNPPHEFVIFHRRAALSELPENAPNMDFVPVEIPWYSWREQALFPLHTGRRGLSLLHVPHVNVPWLFRGRLVVTLHDLTKIRYGREATQNPRDWSYPPRQWLFQKTFQMALARARRIIMPSQATANDLYAIYPDFQQKSRVIYEAADPFFCADELPIGPGYPFPYLLYVGNLYPFKNVHSMIAALGGISAEIHLVIATSQGERVGEYRDAAAREECGDRVHFVLRPSDSILKGLYATARALVMPSFSEGFGLPCVEAMQMGVPVLAARSGSLPEICGDAAFFFDPMDRQDLIRGIRAIAMWNDAPLRASLVERGKKRAADFNWMNTARETLKVYEESASTQ